VIRIDVYPVGKIRPARHAQPTLSPHMVLGHTYLTRSTHSNLSLANDRVGQSHYSREKRISHYIPSTPADRSAGPHQVSLLFSTKEVVARSGRGGCRWADPVCTVRFCNWFEFSKLIWIYSIQKIPSWDRKIPNEIWTCRELNQEQISSLEFFKIQNGIWIKNLSTKLSKIWLNLNSRDLGASEFTGIWHVGT
jgi:hypothetical protein